MKGFIRGKKIIVLPLDDNAKLEVFLDKEHDKYYFNSALYFSDGEEEYLLMNDSLAFTIGRGLYERAFCINEYAGDDFDKELEGMALPDFYDKIDKYFMLTECKGYAMYLIKNNGKIKFLLYKIKTVSNEKKKTLKFPYERLCKIEVAESTIVQWQDILEKEFIPRYIAELKKSDKAGTEEQIQAAIALLKKKKS